MNNYQIIIRISFEALDDIEARQKVKDFMAAHPTIDPDLVKAQRVFLDKPPEKLTL
jgi:hypothetical protein